MIGSERSEGTNHSRIMPSCVLLAFAGLDSALGRWLLLDGEYLAYLSLSRGHGVGSAESPWVYSCHRGRMTMAPLTAGDHDGDRSPFTG